MFSIAVCDDSEVDLREMAGHLSDLDKDGLFSEVATYRDGAPLVADVARGARFDLLVLDMIMEPLDGMSVARKIRALDASLPIVIVTATRRYALEGYEVDACRYLLKPVDDTLRSTARAILTRPPERGGAYYTIRQGADIVRVPVGEIVYFESRRHTVVMHAARGTHAFRAAIGGVEARLRAEGFFRIHKSLLVSLRHVRRMRGPSVLMAGGEALEVSRLRAAGLRAALLDRAAAQGRPRSEGGGAWA